MKPCYIKNIKPGTLYDLKIQDDIDVVEIYRNDPRNLLFGAKEQEYMKVDDYQPIMLLEYWENVKIYTEEYFLIKLLTSSGIISYYLFWNEEEFMNMFKFSNESMK